MPQTKPTNAAVKGIEPILPRPEVALKDMRYAPGIRVTPDMDLVYFSGLTAYPIEVDPWNPGAFKLPESIDEQNRMLTDNLDKLLKAAGITWQHIILMVRHTVEDPSRDFMADKMGDWRPCTTSLWVSETGVPGAKVLYEVTVRRAAEAVAGHAQENQAGLDAGGDFAGAVGGDVRDVGIALAGNT